MRVSWPDLTASRVGTLEDLLGFGSSENMDSSGSEVQSLFKELQ